MSTLPPDFIAQQKEKLEQRRERILHELELDATPSQRSAHTFEARFPDYGDKEDENAAEVAMYGSNLTMEKNLEVSLFNVDRALKKIAEGNYGTCDKCGSVIDIKRLEAFPSAASCMSCKKKS